MAPLSTNPGHDNDASSTAVTKPNSLRIKSRVRTEYVITNIYSYLLKKNGFDQVTELPSASAVELQVTNALINVVSDFKRSYSDRVCDLCCQLEVTSENVNSVFVGVMNELFSEGITWARLATVCVFSSELASQCLQKDLPDVIVDQILDCFLRYLENNMESWINDHGGWESIIEYAKSGNKERNVQAKSASSPGWARSVLHGTVRIFGTLAQIANSTNTAMSFPIQS